MDKLNRYKQTLYNNMKWNIKLLLKWKITLEEIREKNYLIII